MTETETHPDILQALVRGLSVIRTFGDKNPMLTIADAAKQTGLSRATVRRIFLTLQSLGYAEEDSYRRWTLTPRVLELGFSYLSSIDIWELAYPFMRTVSEATGESCSVTVLDGDSSVYVARVPANKVMSVTLGVGSRLPAWVASHGRVLLSEWAEDELERFLRKQPRRSITPATIWEVRPLMNEIHLVRQQGYSLVIDELEEGLMALAVPLRDRRGDIKAALHISASSISTSKDTALNQFLPALQKAASDIQMVMS